MNPKQNVGLKMSLLMGVCMSLTLSLTGLVSAGQFTVPALLFNFVISFVISMIIGLLVPMGKVYAALGQKFHLQPGTLKTRLIETLVSDLIYTPIITVIMITIAYRQAVSHGAPLKYGPMLGRGLVISMIVGYVVIFLISPILMKIAMGGKGRPEK